MGSYAGCSDWSPCCYSHHSRVNRRQGSHLIPCLENYPTENGCGKPEVPGLRPSPSSLSNQPIVGAQSALGLASVGGGEGPPGGCNRENIPFLCSSIWQTPEMLVEIETAWSLSGYLLVCFSAGRLCPRRLRVRCWRQPVVSAPVCSSFPPPPLGYFIHDTVDIVLSKQTRASWEYLVHHVMVRNQWCDTNPSSVRPLGCLRLTAPSGPRLFKQTRNVLILENVGCVYPGRHLSALVLLLAP